MNLRPYLVVSAQSTGVSNVHKMKTILLLVQKEDCVCEMCSFSCGPLPPHTSSEKKLDGWQAWK